MGIIFFRVKTIIFFSLFLIFYFLKTEKFLTLECQTKKLMKMFVVATVCLALIFVLNKCKEINETFFFFFLQKKFIPVFSYPVMLDCWNSIASQRPTMKVIFSFIEFHSSQIFFPFHLGNFL